MLIGRPPLSDEVGANFSRRRCHVISVTDPYGHIASKQVPRRGTQDVCNAKSEMKCFCVQIKHEELY
jgi:hypothetical protein